MFGDPVVVGFPNTHATQAASGVETLQPVFYGALCPRTLGGTRQHLLSDLA